MKTIRSRRCRDWEPFDRIELKVVPRYKTSGLSGDEWRTGVVIKFWFKGNEVHEEFRTSMQAAIMMLPAIWIEAQEPISSKVIELEKKYCDQPGCQEKEAPTFLMRYLIRLASNEGWLAAKESGFQYYRKFCQKHKTRGDCGLEDNDGNYSNNPHPSPAD